eukprot:5202452-Amphidinium_carterae.1
MEYHSTDWYAIEAQRSLERLALRQHWGRSLARLYDKTGKASPPAPLLRAAAYRLCMNTCALSRESGYLPDLPPVTRLQPH